MPKLHSNFIEIALRHGCSPVNLLHIFRTPFPKNTSGWLLLSASSDYFCLLLLLITSQNTFFQSFALKNPFSV